MNPRLFKIYSVKWNGKDFAQQVVVEHIESGKKTELIAKKDLQEEIDKIVKEVGEHYVKFGEHKAIEALDTVLQDLKGKLL